MLKIEGQEPKYVVVMGLGVFKVYSAIQASEMENSLKEARNKLKVGRQPIIRYKWADYKAGDLSKPVVQK